MRLLAGGPVTVATRRWQGSRERMVTLVARITYEIAPIRSEIVTMPERARLSDL